MLFKNCFLRWSSSTRGIIKPEFCDDIERFDDLFLGAFQRIFFFRDTLKTSKEYKEIIIEI